MSAEVGGLTEAERYGLSDLFEANRFDRLCEAVERIVADRERAAEKRGAERALREAADDLAADRVIPWQEGPKVAALWLRARADRSAP